MRSRRRASSPAPADGVHLEGGERGFGRSEAVVERVRLELPRRPMRGRGDALAPFLRRRGIQSTGLSLTICESILEPGTAVEHRGYADGSSTLTLRGTPPRPVVPGR